jgi:uncharacterized protein YbaR (Trm112 family)
VRFYLLDRLVCPRCEHFPLFIDITEQRQGPGPASDATLCEIYCAHEREFIQNLQLDPPCARCLKQQIHSGELTCPECNSRFPIKERIPNLLVDEALNEWIEEEKGWWEERYATVKNKMDTLQIKRIASESEQDVPGNRYYERKRYLFNPLRQRGVQGTSVIEIGAGTSQYVTGLLPPSAGHYFYIGTDVTREALRIGSQLLPEGDFVQCAVGKMPFRKESFDTLLSLGILHHIPFWQASLIQILDLLKPGGWMLFNEVIAKPRVLGMFRKQSLTAVRDSPHEGEIVFNELLDTLQQQGRLVSCHLATTPLRVLLVWVLGRTMRRSLLMTKLILGSDQVFRKSLGRVFRSLGPWEVLGIFEKVETPAHALEQVG